MNESMHDLLVKIPLFKSFSADELTTISKFMNLFEVGKDKPLFNEGDKGDYVCFVVDGRLDVYKKTFDGNDFIVNTLSRGQSFGEMSIIENTPRSATVKASANTIYVTLARKDFELILDEYPKICNKILKGLCILQTKKLRTTTSRLIDYIQKHS